MCQLSFSHFYNEKYVSQELFTPTENEIAGSAQYVSGAPVVLPVIHV